MSTRIAPSLLNASFPIPCSKLDVLTSVKRVVTYITVSVVLQDAAVRVDPTVHVHVLHVVRVGIVCITVPLRAMHVPLASCSYAQCQRWGVRQRLGLCESVFERERSRQRCALRL